MASLEYRFTQSAPVLRDLARTRRRSPPLPLPTGSSEHSDNVKPFEFIDSSLSLLGDLQRVQDNHLRREFEQQREFIAGKFEQEQYENGRRDTAVDQKFTKIVERFTKIKEQLENFKQEVGQRFEEVGQRFEEVGQRFEEVGQRFEEVGQRFDLVETKLDDFRQEVDQRFSEMNARMFNSLSYRAHHQIYPVAVLRGRRLQKPDENCFPRSIKKFWNLQTRKNGESNSSPGIGELSLTTDQLIIDSICFNFTPLRNTNGGTERVKRPNLTRVILRRKAYLSKTQLAPILRSVLRRSQRDLV
jgi:tetrahydromethanopterin S-methyltransferase subunit G